MSRSFPTRLVGSVTRVALLAPCLLLLICSACATPFPYEKLKVGMTVADARQKIGVPAAIKNGSEGARSIWCYHEADFGYIRSGNVLLHFEENKLVRWQNVVRWTTWEHSGSQSHFEAHPPGLNLGEHPGPHSLMHRRYLWCDSILYTSEVTPAGPQWVFDPSTGHPEPETSCKSERASAEARAEASDTRYVARNYVSLWLEPTASSKYAEMSLDRGQPLEILRQRCQWCRVEDDVGTRGWVGCVFLNHDKPL